MKISIIIPVFNCDQYVKTTIESILQQSFTDFELILVDDGSTDSSGIICDSYASKDSRICVLHQKNKGVSSARNAGVLSSSGDYLIFIDSDDTLENNALSVLYEEAVRGNYDLITFGFKKILISDKYNNVEKTVGSEHRKAYDKSQKSHLICDMYENNILYSVWNKMFKRKVILDNNIEFKN